MSQNTRAQNSSQKGDLIRNNAPQYNLRPLLPQVEEQEGDEPPLVARRRVTRHQSCRETRTERLEQRINTLTELVNTLVIALSQNAANVTPAIPLRIPLANAKGEEVPPPQESRDVATGKDRADTKAHRRRARCRRCNNGRARHKDRGTTPEPQGPEHTKDSMFNRLE